MALSCHGLLAVVSRPSAVSGTAAARAGFFVRMNPVNFVNFARKRRKFLNEIAFGLAPRPAIRKSAAHD